ncbi:MAG TPA: tRNA (adenosine(37)-N6)-threonylcarbamoyltransferase complex ATPase subunit type 1 TsaE [Flavobacteriales bacterium]|jgi:tRNA threonylcarbamoyladenosine biosynthesis protein TsaE|nr:tRNA (adenosine(37)-N6)-threonylcarbamoyltransferase complex ATPase subunit type 1 TsaE [Flavobacteriales bacterium]
MKFEAQSVEDLKKIAPQILAGIKQDVVLFIGEMGAGKTSLIKALVAALGSLDKVSSPTFGLVNEYELPHQKRCYHFDFYRLLSEDEALGFGVEEYFDSGQKCFLEWPEKISSLIPDEVDRIHISVENELRIIHLNED